MFLRISYEVYAKLSPGIPTKRCLIFKEIVLFILSPLSRVSSFLELHRLHSSNRSRALSSTHRNNGGKTHLQRFSTAPFSVSRSRLISSVVPSSPFLSFLSPLPVYPKASHCSASPHSLSALADSLLALSESPTRTRPFILY